ncbi:MAG: cation:dicarboxylase symporter family transporter [Chromatiaceae bacterium]|nr:cation:dicarboxylase symporter family transporter [Chromatiaceae bacterium]
MKRTTAKPAETRKRRRLSVATQVFIGLGLGLLVGLFFGEEAAVFGIGGDLFIAALQITVIPYVIVALITSLGRLTLAEAKALSLKAGAVLLALWAIGLLVVLTSPLAFPDWPSASFFSASQIATSEPVDFLRLYVPANIFYSLSNAVVPAIVVFSILFGVALIQVEGKARLVEVFDIIGATLMQITGFIGRLAPYGVFAITANAAGTIDLSELARLQVYILLYILLTLLLSLWVIPALIAALTPLRYLSVLRAFRGPLLTAFATANLLIVLPVLAADGKRLMAETDEALGEEPTEQEASAVDILIPAAFPFPNLGLLMALMFVLFGGWLVGQSVPVSDYPSLAIAGLASLFGGTILALPFLFDLLRLPADLFQTFLVVDVIASRFGTLLAGMHVIAIALIGAYGLKGQIRFRLRPLLRFAIVSLGLLAAILIGVRAFYTYVFVAPFTKGDLLTGLPLFGTPRPHWTLEPGADSPVAASDPDLSTFERVHQANVLRVCHQLSDYPSAFVNSAGNLVGFDIDVAHQFAERLDVAIEFVPVGSIAAAEERLNRGVCDLFMSLLPISPELTLRFAMTTPVLDSALALVVEDHRRREFQRWDAIAEIEDLRIAGTDNRASVRFLQQRLPNAVPQLVDDNAAFDALLAEQPLRIDGLLMPAEEAAAWTIRYPRFNLVTPEPVLLVPFGYAVARGETELLDFLDAWLINARGSGLLDQIYRYWMLGEIGSVRPPRWSIARDLLGWMD